MLKLVKALSEERDETGGKVTNIIRLLFLIISTEVSGKIIFLKDVSVLNLLRKFTMLISKKTTDPKHNAVRFGNMSLIIMFTITLHSLLWL